MNKQILPVDDDPDICFAMKIFFEDADFEFLTAQNELDARVLPSGIV